MICVSRAARHGVLLALLGWVGGCATAHCPAILPDATRLWQEATAGRQVRSLRAEARVDQRGPKGRIKGRVLMFMERPDRVRFDAMTSFGPAAILTSDGERFALTEMREKRFTSGPACPANIARMLGVRLPAEQVLKLLLGELPTQLEAVQGSPRCREGTVEVVRGDESGGRWAARFEVPEAGGTAHLVRLAREDAQGRRQWDVEYEDYHRVATGMSLPRVVRLHDHRSETQLLVRFKEVDVNVAVPEGVFVQAARAGLASQRVACP